MSDLPEKPDAWSVLRHHTAARIGLGRIGSSLPTAQVLHFAAAQARARDAVHQPLDVDTLIAELAQAGLPAIVAESQAANRAEYLRRPDLGRRLCAASAASLAQRQSATHTDPRLTIVIADGLSSLAPARHALPFLQALQAVLKGWTLDLVVARQARVAVGDEIGALRHAQAVAVLIGERPGLTSPDSLGLYLTYAPRTGITDADRNCISNIRDGGLPHAEAARRLMLLLEEAHRMGSSGVALKDRSDTTTPLLPNQAKPERPYL